MAQNTSPMSCQTKWQSKSQSGDPQGLAFEVQVRGHKFFMDSRSEAGSKDLGPSPKEVLLASICVCSGMDVASILQKMRLDIKDCNVDAKTDLTEGYPSIFKEVQMQYRVVSPDAKIDQVIKAVTLSMTKYCGVSAMVAPTSPITYQIFLNEEKIGEGVADFTAAKQG